MEFLRPLEQDILRLEIVRIRNAAIHRADRRARLFVMEADALGAERGVDDEDVLSLADGLVGTLRLARAAVDAFLGNHGCHVLIALPLLKPISIRRLRRLHQGGSRSPWTPHFGSTLPRHFGGASITRLVSRSKRSWC